MKPNLGNAGRIARVVLPARIAGLYFGGVSSGGLVIGLGVVGAIVVATSAVSVCRIYLAVGVATAPESSMCVSPKRERRSRR